MVLRLSVAGDQVSCNLLDNVKWCRQNLHEVRVGIHFLIRVWLTEWERAHWIWCFKMNLKIWWRRYDTPKKVLGKTALRFCKIIIMSSLVKVRATDSPSNALKPTSVMVELDLTLIKTIRALQRSLYYSWLYISERLRVPFNRGLLDQVLARKPHFWLQRLIHPFRV